MFWRDDAWTISSHSIENLVKRQTENYLSRWSPHYENRFRVIFSPEAFSSEARSKSAAWVELAAARNVQEKKRTRETKKERRGNKENGNKDFGQKSGDELNECVVQQKGLKWTTRSSDKQKHFPDVEGNQTIQTYRATKLLDNASANSRPLSRSIDITTLSLNMKHNRNIRSDSAW